MEEQESAYSFAAIDEGPKVTGNQRPGILVNITHDFF